MKIFFDTEFTGLRKDTTLISIGMVTETGETFYAEFNDYDKSQCDEWINENVLKNLIHDNPILWMNKIADVQVYSNKCNVMRALSAWLQSFSDVQFVSDVCHYDMVLLIDLFGGAFDLPKNVSAVCHDINQEIADFYEITDKEAFDKSRENIMEDIQCDPIDGSKHNSLYDAKVIKEIYIKMSKLHKNES